MPETIIPHIRALSLSFEELRLERDRMATIGAPAPSYAITDTYFSRLAPIIADLSIAPRDPVAVAALQQLKAEVDGLIQRHRISRLN